MSKIIDNVIKYAIEHAKIDEASNVKIISINTITLKVLGINTQAKQFIPNFMNRIRKGFKSQSIQTRTLLNSHNLKVSKICNRFNVNNSVQIIFELVNNGEPMDKVKPIDEVDPTDEVKPIDEATPIYETKSIENKNIILKQNERVYIETDGNDTIIKIKDGQ